MTEYLITNEKEKLEFVQTILATNKPVRVKMSGIRDVRTDQQRKALEVYCVLVAKALNDSGYELKLMIGDKETDVAWNAGMVKDSIWRKIQVTMFSLESTTAISPAQVIEVYEVINRWLSGLGISIPWPSNERYS